jgi:RNA-dependent RNA polymerase
MSNTRGQRSLPSYLGGGDLDGDDYNLILDVSIQKPQLAVLKRALQPSLHPQFTSKPGAYKSLPEKETIHPCTVKDVADFVINFVSWMTFPV